MKFNERLKELRLQSALMQKEIAQLLGVSVRTFQHYEAGEREPNIDTLIQIADFFKVSLDELVGRDFPKDSLVDSE